MSESTAAKEGVLVLAEGADYVKQAEKMAASLKDWCAGLPVFLLTDPRDRVSHPGLFASIDHVPKADSIWLRRILAMQRPPCDRTLWLDADILVCGPLEGLLKLLEQYDFAAALAPARKGHPMDEFDKNIPEAFFMLNTGVVAYRKNDRTEHALRLWEDIFREGQERFPKHPAFRIDQPSFHWALWKAEATVYVLPPEFNVRARHPTFLRDRARIIHEVGGNLPELARTYNSAQGPRIFPNTVNR